MLKSKFTSGAFSLPVTALKYSFPLNPKIFAIIRAWKLLTSVLYSWTVSLNFFSQHWFCFQCLPAETEAEENFRLPLSCRIIFWNYKKSGQCTWKLVLSFFETARTSADHLDHLRLISFVRPGFWHPLLLSARFFLEICRSLNSLNQIRYKVSPSLILILHLWPSWIYIFLHGNKCIVTASVKTHCKKKTRTANNADFEIFDVMW